MARPAGSLTKAIEVLRSLTVVCRASKQYRLPTVARLSRRAEVSPVTMCKAIAVLKNEGVLSTRQGRWIEIVGIRLDQPEERIYPREEKWRRIQAEIQKEILEGVYPHGVTLPFPKELSRKYGVCYRTLKKALNALEKTRTLVPFKKTFMVPSLAGKISHGTVVLVAVGDRDGLLKPFTPRIQELLRTLEAECSKIRANLEIITYDPQADEFYLHGKISNVKRLPIIAEAVLGFMVWTMGLTSERSTELIRRLLPHTLPVSVLDETGGFDTGALPVIRKRFRHFSMANSVLAGRNVGQFLLNLGHRQVAYISPFHASLWSRNRLHGLQTAFAEAGFSNAVVTFTIDQESFAAEYAVQAQSIHTMIDAMISSAFGTSEQMKLMPAILAIREQINQFEQTAFRGELLTLLEQAFRCDRITAWVGANDNIALEALAFLENRGVSIPLDKSIIGFDDSLAAFLKKLTSYNFNGPSVVHAILETILKPQPLTYRKLDRAGPFELEGFISQRSSTASPRERLGSRERNKSALEEE